MLQYGYRLEPGILYIKNEGWCNGVNKHIGYKLSRLMTEVVCAQVLSSKELHG